MASWNFWFGLLDLYAEESNHARVPPASFKTGDGYQLGSWVSDQRKVKQKHKLSDKWNVRLESLSRWVRDVIAFQWNEDYAHLQGFVDRERHARVPQRFKTSEGYALRV